MTDPISIHNVPDHASLPSRATWDEKSKRRKKPRHPSSEQAETDEAALGGEKQDTIVKPSQDDDLGQNVDYIA